jgi:hypothetical protein
MRYYAFTLFFLILGLSACKTCETQTKIAEGFTKYVVTALECKNASNVKADIKDMCSEHDFCSKTKIVPVQAIPDGSWSEAALSCLFVTGNLENLALTSQKRWGCKKTLLTVSELEKVCEAL